MNLSRFPFGLRSDRSLVCWTAAGLGLLGLGLLLLDGLHGRRLLPDGKYGALHIVLHLPLLDLLRGHRGGGRHQRHRVGTHRHQFRAIGAGPVCQNAEICARRWDTPGRACTFLHSVQAAPKRMPPSCSTPARERVIDRSIAGTVSKGSNSGDLAVSRMLLASDNATPDKSLTTQRPANCSGLRVLGCSAALRR